MTTHPLRWGILGTGGIAHSFVSDLLANGHQVAAVGSRTLASAQAFADEFALETAHGDYASLVADAAVDIVYVATPHPMHASNALLAVRAGKPVLVEKAFTLNADEARLLVDEAAARGVFVMEAMWTRFLPHMIRIREILAAGTIGEIRAVTADHTQNLPRDPAHRLNDPALGGGALLDLGIYPVSFVWDVLGAPATITAHAAFTATGVDETIATIFGYPDGAVATTLSSMTSAGPDVASILGTRGRIDLDAVWYTATSFRVYDERRALIEEFHSEISGAGYHLEAAEVERRVAAGEIRSPLMTPEESVAIMGGLDSIRRAVGLRYPSETAPGARQGSRPTLEG